MDKEMFNYIDSLEEEVKTSQSLFWKKWNQLIRKQFQLPVDFQISSFIDLFGGYIMDNSSYSKMDNALISFYNRKVKINDTIRLRGFDYYCSEPLLHFHNQKIECDYLWISFKEKWRDYSFLLNFDFINSKCSFENWLGSLAFLEYLFEDLTVIRWFVFRNKLMLTDIYRDSYKDLVERIVNFTEIIAESLACLLKFDFEKVNQLLTVNYNEFFKSFLMNDFMNKNLVNIDKASTRTVREGDSLILVYAAYLMKLKPACEFNKWKKIDMLSNAFGAMNTGLILKYLISPLCRASHKNILYAQHRIETDLVYEDTMINECYYIDLNDLSSDSDALIVIDDSVCLGKSYKYIKEYVNHRNTFLLPLTFNCNGLKFFRVSVTEKDDIKELIYQSVKWAKEINEVLPCFFSFWDFQLVVPESTDIKDKNYCYAKYGSDLLLKHLWEIYYEEICSFGNK